MPKKETANAEIIIQFIKDKPVIVIKKVNKKIFFTPTKSQAFLLGGCLMAYGTSR